MPLSGNISAPAGTTGNKDLTQGYQPLLLVTFTWIAPDQSIVNTLRLSTHPLNTLEGGFQYAGNDYTARVMDQAIDAVQAMSDTGIDIPPTLTLKLADADRFLWTNFEKTLGFKGASLVVTLVLWEADTGNFSSDSYVKFTGICNSANCPDEATLEVSASSKMNMQKVLLPIIPIQQRDPWIFPTPSTLDPTGSIARTQALNNPASSFFECGYSADIAGGRGNHGAPNQPGITDANGVFISCQYTKTDCVARGMYSKDSNNNITGHFGGVQWEPPLWWKSKSYLEGKTVSGINSANEPKYGEYMPLVYGKTFVDGVVLNVIGDGNSTRMEVLICFGNVGNASLATMSTGGISMVICNDVAIPFNFNYKLGGPKPADSLFRWNYTNFGARDSTPTNDAGYNDSSGNPQGDPYGNLCVIEIVVPKVLADSQSVPRVRILLTGPQVRVYTDPNTFTLQTTSNPIWILMDLLIQANWLYTQLNIQSFIDAAAVCDVQINYTNNAGSVTNFNADSSPHRRYSCSMAVKQRRTAADIIRGLRNSCKAMLIPNDTTGLLQVFIKQSLGDQQRNSLGAIAGSNNGAGVNSIHADGSAAVGFSAYDFDESSILEKQDGSSSLVITQRSILNSPNRISVNFQDQDNQWVADSLTQVDPVDIARAGQEVASSVQADGINSYDQGRRVFETMFAEAFRGNPRGDSGGTMVFEFETTQKAAHLHVGQICRFSHQQLGLSFQMVRVIKLQPSRDHETVKVTLQWHSDSWYADTYGQSGYPSYSTNQKQGLARPPFGWQPFQEGSLASDPIWSQSTYTFGMAQTYETAGDGSSIARLVTTGKEPVASFAGADIRPPLIAVQGTTSNGTGTLQDGSVFYAVVSTYDSSTPKKLSAPTPLPCIVATPQVTSVPNTNSITIPVPAWPGTPIGWVCFAGKNPNTLTFQATGAGTPSSITINNLNDREYGVPDVMYDHLELHVKRQIHGGVWGAAVSAVTPTTLQFAGAAFTVNQWAGYDLSITGRFGDALSLPVWNLRIASNTADTLTVAGGTPDLTTLPSANAIHGIHPGDAAVMRAKPSTFSALTIGDANFVNSMAVSGLTVNEGAYVVRIWAGTGGGQWRRAVSNTSTVYTVDKAWDIIPDATSRFWIEEADWQPPVDSSVSHNQDLFGPYSGNVEISNYKGTSIVCQALTIDSNGNACFEQDAPIRDFFIFGSAGTIPNATPAADVTIGAITYAYTQPTDQSTGVRANTLELTVPYTIPGGWAGLGVHAYIEYPDGSSTPAWFSLDGTNALDGTHPLAGDFKPIDEGKFPYIATDPATQVVIKDLPAPGEVVNIRVYLAAYTSSIDNVLVRATLASPTPSAVVTVNPPPVLASGEEYAAQVTNLAASSQYGLDGQGHIALFINVSWTPPTDPRFQGVGLVLLRPPNVTAPSGTRTATLQASQPSALTLGGGMQTGSSLNTSIGNFPSISEFDTLYALSIDLAGAVNTYVPGVTPSITLELDPPASGSAGMEFAALVTGFTCSVTYGVSPDGIETYGFAGSATLPTDPAFGGYQVVLHNEADGANHGNDINLGSAIANGTFNFGKWPIQGPQPTWDAYALSFDAATNTDNTLVPGTTPRVVGLNPVVQTTGSMKATRLDSSTLDPSMSGGAGVSLAVANLGITSGKLATSAVTTAKLAALSVDATILATSAVTATKIANLAVGTAAIALLAVGNAQIAFLAVGDAQISDLAATKLTAGTLQAGVIYAGTINCSQLNAGTINAAITITTVTLTTATINGGAISGTTLVLNKNSLTVSIDAGSNGAGTYGVNVQDNSSNAFMTLQPTRIWLDDGASHQSIPFQFASGVLTVRADTLVIGQLPTSVTTATGGSVTLPANPTGFFIVKDSFGTTRKIPCYDN